MEELTPFDSSSDFDDFFRQSEGRLRHGLVARLGSERGRDAAAEALAWAFENWERVSSMTYPLAYLHRVGISRTRLRRRAFLPRSPSHEPEHEPQLLTALRALSPSQRQCVVLVFAYEWRISEVADLTGTSQSAVRTHIDRGVKRLRKQLGAEHEALRSLDRDQAASRPSGSAAEPARGDGP